MMNAKVDAHGQADMLESAKKFTTTASKKSVFVKGRWLQNRYHHTMGVNL